MRTLLGTLLTAAAVSAMASPAHAQTIPSGGGGGGYGFGYLGAGYLGYHWANPTLYSLGMYPGTGFYPGPIFLNDPPKPDLPVYKPWFSGPLPVRAGCASVSAVEKGTGTFSGATREKVPVPFSANADTGLRILEVKAGPAQAAGVPRDAVIVSLGDRRVRTPDELRDALRASPNAVKLTVIEADGERVTREVTLVENRLGLTVIEAPLGTPAVSPLAVK